MSCLVDVRDKKVETPYCRLIDLGFFSCGLVYKKEETIHEQWQSAEEVYLVANNFSPRGENNRLLFFVNYEGNTLVNIIAIESMDPNRIHWILPLKSNSQVVELLNDIRRRATIQAKDHGLGNWANLEEITMALFYQEGPTSYRAIKHE